MKTKKMKMGVSTAVATALVASTIAVPQAFADGGNESHETGIVWGMGQDGTYMVDTAQGELQGFCIDPGLAYPRQGNRTQYGEPVKYMGLNPHQRKAVIAGSLVGNEIMHNNPMAQQALDLISSHKLIPNLEGPLTKDQVMAGISGVIHQVGWDVDAHGKPGAHWNGKARIGDHNARTVFDFIWGGVNGIPDQVLDMTGIDVLVRAPADGSNKQRMLITTDLRLPTIDMNMVMQAVAAVGIGGGLIGLLVYIFKHHTPPKSNPPRTNDGGGNQGKTSQERKTEVRVTGGKETVITNSNSSSSTSTKPVAESSSTTVSTSEKSSTTTSTTASKTTTTSDKSTTTKPKDEKKDDKTPSVRTSAGAKDTNVVEVGKDIVDTVTYDNLTPNKKYKLIGETADSATGELLGNKGELEFTPSSTRGEIDVKIPIKNANSKQVVVFETLYEITANGEKKVAEHRDLTDKAQTVGKPTYTPEIRTLADSNTGDLIQSGTTINDQVSFSGLEVGKEYRLEARLMDKSTGADTGALQVKNFKPEKSAGTVTVENIAVTNPDAMEQVVFERLFDAQTNELIALHEDINDAAQTVGGPQDEILAKYGKKKKKKVAPKTAPAPAPQQAPAPRQAIGSVPSGEFSVFGSTIFNR